MADTYSYQAPDLSTTLSALSAEYNKIGKKHVADKKWYRKYQRWSEFWRDTTQGALYGLNGGPATDPMAQLQSQLMNQYSANPASYNQNYNMGSMVNARNNAVANALRQRAAGMGMQNIYQPSIDAASNARQTLINQSMAAYRPMAYQAQQQISGQQDQLLQSIAMADLEGKSAIAGAGRSA